MFDFSKWFKKSEPQKEENKKPLIIAIHGFGKRRTHEYNNLKSALKDYDIVIPELFDQTKEDDVYWYNWVSKAEEAIIKAKNEKREIVLIGFSMGGVIATYLASKFVIKKLILLAPAFEYMTVTTVQTTVNHALFKKADIEDVIYEPLPTNFTPVFMEVVNNCKDAIDKVSCPTVIMHCMEDEVIPYTVSQKYYKKLAIDDKKLILYGDGQHRILDDERIKDTCINTILYELSLLENVR